MRLVAFFVVALALASPASGSTVEEYLGAIVNALGLPVDPSTVVAECECLTGALLNNSCPTVCESEGCESIVSSISACTVANCPEGNICRIGLSQFPAASVCANAGAFFVENQTFCGNPTISSFLGALELHDEVRAKCQSVNELIQDGDDNTCGNLCNNNPTTCAAYLGELAVCAKNARDRACYDAVLALRAEILFGVLDCQNFDELHGACEVVHTAEGIVNFTAMTFDNLLPLDFGVVLSGDVAADCACLIPHLAECDVCQARDQCTIMSVLAECASDQPDCSATDCAATLDRVFNFATNTSCYEVDGGEVNCTDPFPALNCTPFYNETTCQALVDDVIDDKPVFSNLPSSSGTPTPSVTPSETPSNPPTGTQSPSISVSPTSAAFAASPTLLMAALVSLGLALMSRV